MPLLPSLRQLGFVLGGVLLAALTGCGKSHSSSNPATSQVVISGKVTYDRIPLVRAANGVPTGLETDPTKFELNLPARYITVNLYQKVAVPDPLFPNDRTKDKIFFGLHGSAATADGTYSFSVDPDLEWMVEVQSSIHLGAATSPADVNLIADPNGLTSTLPHQNRLRYCIRKAPDGTLPPTAPSVNHVATSKVAAGSPTTVVDFHIGVGDSWFLADVDHRLLSSTITPRLVPGYSEGLVVGGNPNGYQKAGQLEATPTGSRVLSILDAFVDMAAYLGTSGTLVSITPGGSGTTLDLHYLQGRSEPGGTHIAWDRSLYPQGQAIDPNTSVPTPTGFNASFDAATGTFHYFGSVQAGASNDDAWDRSKLISLAAKAYLFQQISRGSFFAQSNPLGKYTPLPQDAPLTNLEPQMALLEGLPDGLAAVILKNPYITDTTSTGLTYRDIRDLGAVPPSELTVFSAPFHAALIWELALKANAIPRSEVPADWAKIIPATVSPLASLIEPFGNLDTINLYPQLKAMQSTLPGLTSTTSPFTDTVLRDLLTQMGVPAGNIPWPRPSVGPLSAFVASWGADPISNPTAPATSTIAPIVLSMGSATPVAGIYGNMSPGEVAFAHFTVSRTKIYAFDVQFPGGPLTNGQVEVSLIGIGTPDGVTISTYTFTNSTSTSIPLTLQAPLGAASTWLVRMRMLSPTVLQPDTTVAIKLVPAA